MGATLGLHRAVLGTTQAMRFPRTRIWSNQEWALSGVPGVEGLVEYEARFNFIAAQHDHWGVCVFDLNRHSGAVVIDMIRTHPLVVIGGLVYENPVFTPADQFLAEIRAS
jgi:hypothetical protein